MLIRGYETWRKCWGIILVVTVALVGCAANDAALKKSSCPPCPDVCKPLAYPKTARETVTEKVHQLDVTDPYRWLEDEHKAEKWLDRQNAFTSGYLAAREMPGLEEQVEAMFGIGFIASPALAGGKLFYLKRDEPSQEQPVLRVREGDEDRALIDLNQLDPDFKTAIDWFAPSRDGKLLAYGLSKDGSEDSTLYVLNVETGEVLPDQIPNTRAAAVAWTPDGSGFYYTRYPEGDRYNRKAYFHSLDADWNKDPLVFGAKRDKADWTSLDLSDDGKTLVIMEHRGWSNSDLYLYDTKTKRLRTLLLDLGATLGAQMAGGKLYAATQFGAPNGRVVVINPYSPKPPAWKTIIPEDKWPIEAFFVAKDRIVLQKLENVSNALRIFKLTGAPAGEVKLPDVGVVESLANEVGSTRLAFVFNSFFYPPALSTFDAATEAPAAAVAAKIEAPIDPAAYEMHQVEYPSYDGTMVNMFIVHKKGLAKDGQRQTLLYGYGGFQVNMTPYFSRRVLTWIARGGVYAVANIRGGGERGEAWHQAGMKEKKFQVFEDFEYAMRYLIRDGYTNPGRLVIEGGSNGGLLVGAMMVRAPHLFAVALGSVGLYDMIRYTGFPPGEMWAPEYGTAAKPEDAGYLYGYSPYHQVMDGVAYPAFYGDTADTDNRVHWMHTAKFVAALQHATTNCAPILFHIDRRAGHGQGKGKSDVAKEYVDKFTFVYSIVGDPAAEAGEEAAPAMPFKSDDVTPSLEEPETPVPAEEPPMLDVPNAEEETPLPAETPAAEEETEAPAVPDAPEGE